jgi:transcriptional regulator with XRE-family HTH domain
MSSSAVGAWLRERRQERGWAVSEMARQLRAAAARAADTLPSNDALQRMIRRWEAGQEGGISERYQLHYCRAFGLAPGQFGPGGPPPGEILTAISEESLEFGDWAGQTHVADTTIEQIATQVRHLARDYVHGAPLPLLLEARRLRDRITRQLRGHARLDQARELYLLAAQICGLLAWMTGDLGSYRAADNHAWTAWVCATQAGHDASRAWIRATQAKLAYWDGQAAESAQLAADGLGYDCPGSGRTFLALLRARALACARQPAAARLALDQAAAERDSAAGSELVGGLWSLTPGRYHALAASTWLQLADPSRALAEAGEAITCEREAPEADRNYGAEMHAHIDQALAHLLGRDVDGAASSLQPVLSMPADARYHTLAQHLATTRPLLAQAGTAHAHALTEQIAAYQPGRGVTASAIAP